MGEINWEVKEDQKESTFTPHMAWTPLAFREAYEPPSENSILSVWNEIHKITWEANSIKILLSKY